MTDILIWTAVVLAAGLVTAVIVWPKRIKPTSHDIDSAEVIKALRGKG